MSAWWTCPLCYDRMAESIDPRNVEHDRDEHLRNSHPEAWIKPRLMVPSWWPTTGEPERVRV